MIRNKVTNTSPLFFHAAGAVELSPLWPSILQYEASLPATKAESYEGVYTFITWQGGSGAYWKDKELPLFNSLQRLGVTPMILGREITDWRNTMKIDTLLTALESITTPYIIAADLTDVAITGDPMRAVKMLEKLGADLVYCGEDYFWPPELIELHKKELAIPGALETPYTFLNSGIFVAKTSACKALFNEARSLIEEDDGIPRDPDRRFNDQPIMKEVYVRNFPRVQLDLTCEVFQLITRQTPGELDITLPSDDHAVI